MDIKEAIRSRYDRFNRLWLEATGHTFEDDEKWCEEQNEKEMKELQPKIDEALSKHGFSSEDEYRKSLVWRDGGIGGSYYENNIEEIDTLLSAKPRHSSLLSYERMCIDEAKRCAEWILEEKNAEWWQKTLEGDNTIYYLIDKIKEAGFSFDDGHSANSIGAAILMTDTLIRFPDMFQYLHGALTPLVGDEGYHDDRSDIPKCETEENKEEEKKETK